MKMQLTATWMAAILVMTTSLFSVTMASDDPFYTSGEANSMSSSSGSSISNEYVDGDAEDVTYLLGPLLTALRFNLSGDGEQVDKKASESAPPTIYRRSHLNKNFIRFGRSGIAKALKRAMDDDDGALRPSRGLQSNFIRFGRSFYPVNLNNAVPLENNLPKSYRRLGRGLSSNFIRFG